jgi:cyclase
MTQLIQAGAEKVSINSAAVKTPDLITEAARKFGAQAVVVNIDPKRMPSPAPGREETWWEVHINGGRVGTGLEAVAWAKRVEQLGAGEIVLTSMDADGTRAGYDLEMTQAVAEAVRIPVVASGGAGHPDHLRQVLTVAKADAALAASIFHYNEFGVRATKKYLAERGVPVRMVD